jgi:hypothetical protein
MSFEWLFNGEADSLQLVDDFATQTRADPNMHYACSKYIKGRMKTFRYRLFSKLPEFFQIIVLKDAAA